MSFSNEHLEFYKINPNGINFRNLIKNNSVIASPDFIGMKGDIICHYEHTVYMDDNKKIIVSGEDGLRALKVAEIIIQKCSYNLFHIIIFSKLVDYFI
jgi:hypothetical protein